MNADFAAWLPVIQQVVVQVGIPLVVGILGWAGAWLGKKFKSDTLGNRIAAIAQLAGVATAEVSQVYVDVVKRQGGWNDAAKREAKNLAIAKLIALAKAQLGLKLDEVAAGSYVEDAVRTGSWFKSDVSAPAPVSQP